MKWRAVGLADWTGARVRQFGAAMAEILRGLFYGGYGPSVFSALAVNFEFLLAFTALSILLLVYASSRMSASR